MATITLTVEQLVNLVTNESCDMQPNGRVLLSLLHIIINKLNIGEEKIQIEGSGLEKLEDMVQNLKPPFEIISTDFGHVVKGDFQRSQSKETKAICDQLTAETQIKTLEDKLKKSSDRLLRMENEIYELRKLENAASCARNYNIFTQIANECAKCRCDIEKEPTKAPCCIDYSNPFNEIVLSLLSNNEFLIELMKRISCPILDKVSNWENQIQLLGDLFQKFLNKTEEEYNKIPTPETNWRAIKQLRADFEQFREDFLAVLNEIQAMLDAKLDKIDILPLKEYIVKELKLIHDELEYLKKYDDCADGLGTTKAIFENLTCILCAGTVCQRSRPRKISSFPKAHKGKSIERKTDDIAKVLPMKRSCGGAHTITTAEERIFRLRNLADEFNVEVMNSQIALIEGKDGNWYRAQPEVPLCTCGKPKEKLEECTCISSTEVIQKELKDTLKRKCEEKFYERQKIS